MPQQPPTRWAPHDYTGIKEELAVGVGLAVRGEVDHPAELELQGQDELLAEGDVAVEGAHQAQVVAVEDDLLAVALDHRGQEGLGVLHGHAGGEALPGVEGVVPEVDRGGQGGREEGGGALAEVEEAAAGKGVGSQFLQTNCLRKQ